GRWADTGAGPPTVPSARIIRLRMIRDRMHCMAAPERTEQDITGLLNSAGHLLSNRLAAALADVGLTPREQCVLVHALEEERTQIQLAALADLDKTTMVSTVDQLEKRGLAERRPSATDRRARIIAVTEQGRLAA